MRKLKSNKKIIKEYEKFILIEVTCENGAKYRTTIDKWTPKNVAKVSNSNRSDYTSLGFMRGGVSL